MNKTVCKYQLKDEMNLPEGAEILKVSFQKTLILNAFFVWALVDQDNKEELRTFQIIPTGGSLRKLTNSTPKFIDTCIGFDDSYVISVFENINKK
jgi:hypothetical protein